MSSKRLDLIERMVPENHPQPKATLCERNSKSSNPSSFFPWFWDYVATHPDRINWYVANSSDNCYPDMTALHVVCENEYIADAERIVQKLINLGADPNLPSLGYKCQPPLFSAARGGTRWPLCARLLKAGANIYATDQDGHTVWHSGSAWTLALMESWRRVGQARAVVGEDLYQLGSKGLPGATVVELVSPVAPSLFAQAALVVVRQRSRSAAQPKLGGNTTGKTISAGRATEEDSFFDLPKVLREEVEQLRLHPHVSYFAPVFSWVHLIPEDKLDIFNIITHSLRATGNVGPLTLRMGGQCGEEHIKRHLKLVSADGTRSVSVHSDFFQSGTRYQPHSWTLIVEGMGEVVWNINDRWGTSVTIKNYDAIERMATDLGVMNKVDIPVLVIVMFLLCRNLYIWSTRTHVLNPQDLAFDPHNGLKYKTSWCELPSWFRRIIERWHSGKE